MAAGVLYPARQVGYGIVLAVAVLVKLAVGVVEQQAFTVGVQQPRILSDHLVEGGRILEGKAAAGQFLPPLAPHLAGCPQVPLIHQHQVVVAEVLHGHTLDALLLGQFVQVDNLNGREQIGGGLGGKQPRPQAARLQLALVLRRHLLVGRQQDGVVEPSAGSVQVVLELQNVGVHEERLARAGRALEGNGAQIFGLVIRHGRGPAIFGLGFVQVGAQLFGIVKIAAQVVFGEKQSEVLIGLPLPSQLAGHAQLAAVRRDVGVVGRKLVGRDRGEIRIQIQRASVFAFTAAGEACRRVPQPLQHGGQALVAELAADEAVKGKAVL